MPVMVKIMHVNFLVEVLDLQKAIRRDALQYPGKAEPAESRQGSLLLFTTGIYQL
jgi:hypothetical protein